MEEVQEEIKLEDTQVPVNDTLEIKHGDKSVILKMTFFNLSRLTKLAANNYEEFLLGYIDPSMQEQIVITIFSDVDTGSGEIKLSEERKAFVADLTPDEANDIYNWCEAHITNFFMKRLLTRKALDEKNEAIMKKRVNLFVQLGLMQKKTEKTETSKPSKTGSKA